MPSLKHLLTRSGLELWLPLGLLGIAFWLAGYGWTHHYLGVAGRAIAPLVLAPNAAVQDEGILSISAVINGDRARSVSGGDRRITRVEVIVVKPVPRTLDFYLPLQSPSAIEAEMARRLKVSKDTIRRLIRYENVQP
ncbi:hypothetical protein PGN35_018850 [Nodosilinea sp. PGN35]|uniref:hypothetical protein n=1 Tax=Nodosilinea sp. PGN35 TaxID=3020489 RepID=UPI0023B20868|nr:hypothetical protein [Nodosilinea sp. TSF1-S3]MDF0366720.1 hypothetical protein [Nodosilinea sp. TSF1-S3]